MYIYIYTYIYIYIYIYTKGRVLTDDNMFCLVSILTDDPRRESNYIMSIIVTITIEHPSIIVIQVYHNYRAHPSERLGRRAPRQEASR